MHGSPDSGQFIDVGKVTRIEIVRPGEGQLMQTVFTESVQLYVQDDGRTLKVWVGPDSSEARETWLKTWVPILAKSQPAFSNLC